MKALHLSRGFAPLLAGLLITLAPFAWIWAQPPGETMAFINAQRVREPGSPAPRPGSHTLVVKDGKIVEFGPSSSVPIPPDAKIVDLRNQVVIPGLVVAETTLVERGRDDVQTLTPHYRAIDGFDFYANYDSALAGGVTTVEVSPGSKRLLPGQGGVVKLAGVSPEARTLREVESLRIILGDAYKNAPKIYEPPVGAVSVDKPLEPTQPQIGGGLAGVMAGLRLAFDAACDQPVKERHSDPMLRALSQCVGGKQRIRVTAPTAADVLAALSLARDYKLKLILADVDPSALTANQWKEVKDLVDGVVISPGLRPGMVSDPPIPDPDAPKARSVRDLVRDLRAADIRIALRPLDDADLKDMLFLGSVIVSGGVPAGDALKMLTQWPAEMLGIEARVGTLEKGKDADFLVLSGDPFAPRTLVREVYVGGKCVYQAPAASAALLLKARTIQTGGGEVIQQGQLLIEGGKLRAVGRDISWPPSAAVRDLGNAVIVPGFVDLQCGLGFGGPVTQPIQLGAKLADRLVSGDPAVALARQGGVTTVLFAGPGTAVTPVVAFKLGDMPRLLREPVALKASLTGNLTQAGGDLRAALRAGKTYADAWAKYEAELPEYEKKKAEYEELKKKLPPEKKAEEQKDQKKEEVKDDKKPEATMPALPPEPKAPAKPELSEALEPYRSLFAQKLPLFVEARRLDAIKLAVQIGRDEFPVKLVLIGADDAPRAVDLLVQKNVAVAVGPQMVRTVERAPVNLPQTLANRDLRFGFASQATTGVKTLPWAVRYAVRGGLSGEDALCAFTSCPARLLDLESVGLLAPGKDADLVVFSGSPFSANSRVLAVMIDGKWVYEEEQE
jgi:imidazolonepropionase-like amidohydrolase